MTHTSRAETVLPVVEQSEESTPAVEMYAYTAEDGYITIPVALGRITLPPKEGDL